MALTVSKVLVDRSEPTSLYGYPMVMDLANVPAPLELIAQKAMEAWPRYRIVHPDLWFDGRWTGS